MLKFRSITLLLTLVGLCTLISLWAIAQGSGFEAESTITETQVSDRTLDIQSLYDDLYVKWEQPNELSLEINYNVCTLPKPKDIGCTTIGKPCITYMCVAGEWEPINVDTSPPSRPRPRPNFPPIHDCSYSDTGFCPAECSVCY